MANYQFTADLISDILFRAREPQAGSDWATQVLVYLNRAYQSLWHSGNEFTPTAQIDWYWLRKSPPGSFTLDPVYDTGTVVVTNGGLSPGFNTAPSSALGSFTGRIFRVTGHPDVFRIASHVAGSNVCTLSSVYTGPTASAAAFDVTRLEYDVPEDCIRIIDDLKIFRTGRYFQRYTIKLGDIGAMEREWPLALLESGPPDRAAYVTDQRIRFNRGGGSNGSTDLYRVEFDYIARPALLTSPGTTEEPVVPRDHRKTLADMALYYLWIDKNDERSAAAQGLAQAGLASMLSEQWYTEHVGDEDFGRIRPRSETFYSQGYLRTESGLLIG